MDRRGLRCAVLGRPIAHSLSPVLHRAAYDALGLDWTYDAVEVGAEDLPGFLDGLGPEWRGLSLTMPLKRSVLPLLDELDESARRSGGANTVVIDEHGRRGWNTDVAGIRAAIRERTEQKLRSAVVLGGGATAASALLALADEGIEVATLMVRNAVRAEDTIAALARHPEAPALEVALLDDVVPEADVLVSTVPAAAQSPDLVAACADVPVVFDVVYDPWPTPLSASVGDDRTLVSGLDLLVHQAVLQVELMTGTPGPLDVMRAAGERALTERG